MKALVILNPAAGKKSSEVVNESLAKHFSGVVEYEVYETKKSVSMYLVKMACSLPWNYKGRDQQPHRRHHKHCVLLVMNARLFFEWDVSREFPLLRVTPGDVFGCVIPAGDDSNRWFPNIRNR